MAPNDGILCFSTMIQTHLSEEATQTEESGNSSLTDYGQIDDSSEEESVIERLSRLFSAVSFFYHHKKVWRKKLVKWQRESFVFRKQSDTTTI